VHMQMYAAYLWELCTAIVLPYEFAGVAEQFIERLQQLETEAGALGIEGALANARAFKAAAGRLDAAAEQWRARYASGATSDETPAEVLNECMKRLSRALVPLASTSKGTYGHDPYGDTPQGTMIPSLFGVAQFAKMQDGEERWMLQTHLTRARNRVADALGDCCRLIDETLARLQ